MLYMSSLV